MVQARSGTVTLLFTDVERSTELLQKLGDEEAQALWHTHFRLLRNAVTARAGQEVKNMGDGLMVVFSSTVDALACGVAMQQAVRHHNQQHDERHQLRVRVGVHVGEPIRAEGDYFGTPVVIAKRLCDCARGGQVIVSDLVRRLIGSRGGYPFQELGPISLKGIPEPLLAWEVAWESFYKDFGAQLPFPALFSSIESPSFVGRQQELEELRGIWTKACEGKTQLVLLAGDAGIGKTRLAAEFSRTVHAEGANVLFGGVDKDANLPFQPFVEAIRHYITACPLDLLRLQMGTMGVDLARIVPELSLRMPDLPAPPPEDPDSQRSRIFNAFSALLTEMSKVRSVVLVLDDLHWTDRQTALLLRHIIRSPEQMPLLVLATYREAELPKTHPLSDTLADVRRSRAVKRLLLKGLKEGEVEAMIDARIGHGASPAFVSMICGQTEGNPFFIGEVLHHLEETGAIHECEGFWKATVAIEQMGIPEGVKEIIERRLSRLSEECNSILTVAAAIGREFGLEALGRASGIPATHLLDLLEEANAAHLVTEVAGAIGRYSFSHTLIHETLYDELTTTRRVHLHGQTLRYADSNGVKLAYEILGGSGPYITVVGLSSCSAVRPRNWGISTRWDRICSQCRVILYDRRGVGFSAAPERGYSLLASVEDILAVLDAVGAERTFVWGAADGGPLAITLAVRHSDRVKGLILAGTSPKLLNSEDFTFGINPASMDSLRRSTADGFDRGRVVSEVTRTRSASERADAIAGLMRRVPQHAWTKILMSIGAADARPLLSEIRVPTLILHDPTNNYIPVDAAYYMHERIADSRLEITDEYGGENFSEAVTRSVRAFIDEVISYERAQP